MHGRALGGPKNQAHQILVYTAPWIPVTAGLEYTKHFLKPFLLHATALPKGDSRTCMELFDEFKFQELDIGFLGGRKRKSKSQGRLYYGGGAWSFLKVHALISLFAH